MEKIKNFLKNEIVLTVSFLLAVASSFVVKPTKAYLDYIDFRTLGLLFSLMVIMAGFNGIGVFSALARGVLKKVKSFQDLHLFLWCCAFLCQCSLQTMLL